jgi:uncharacterized protein involved in copper resistance
MRSKASPFRTLISLFVAAVFTIAVMPGSMAMPAPKAADHAMSMTGMDCSGKNSADCDHMKAHQDQGKPCRNMAACLGMLSCFGMGAIETAQVSYLPALADVAPAIVQQATSGLTLIPDNPPPIA